MYNHDHLSIPNYIPSIDIVEKRINYAKECDDEIVGKKDSSITEWHNLSKFVRMRELNALANFFRSFVSCLTQFKKYEQTNYCI